MVMPVTRTPKELDAWTPSATSYQHVVVQQSVTMLAYMDRTTQNDSQLSSEPEPRVFLGFSIHDLPIVIGAAAGAVGLTIIILVAVIAWHCCRVNPSREKAYCVESMNCERGAGKSTQQTVVHNDSVVFLGGKPTQLYETQVLEAASRNSGLRRSRSLPFKERDPEKATTFPRVKHGGSRSRPSSQPVVSMSERKGSNGDGLPSIPENHYRHKHRVQEVALNQCASFSTLEEPCSFGYMHMVDSDLKTRSLPGWGRMRPLSTEDDLNELYAKVSFSKKRKNRMGKDSAAAIALNKSRSNCVTCTHKDTDSLVENEAIVVYDERTAL